MLSKLADRLMEKADEVAKLETLHNGKPIFEARQIEIPAAAECLEYYAGWADKVTGETIPVKGNYLTYTLREPLGVIAAIVPWNFPLLLASWKVGPALATGNTVILKPAPETPLTALALGEIAVEVGLPPGVLNVLTGPGADIGQALVAHPGIDKIAFTGDHDRQGDHRSAADTLKRSRRARRQVADIVLADADLDAALRARRRGLLRQGEVCGGRLALLCDRSIDHSWRSCGATRIWSPRSDGPKNALRSLASKRHSNRAALRGRREEGRATLVAAASAPHRHGKVYFFQPTVFAR